MYNTIIRACSNTNSPELGLAFYSELLEKCLDADNYTYPYVIKSSGLVGSVSDGLKLHGIVVKAGFVANTYIHCSLINMYVNFGFMENASLVFEDNLLRDVVTWTSLLSGFVKCGDLEAAIEVFEQMPERNLVSWNAMIDGFVQFGRFSEALGLLREMQASGLRPDQVALTSALSACAHLGALDLGKWVHVYLEKRFIRWSIALWTSLVSMYARSGWIESSLRVFHEMPGRDLLAWNAMIGGLAIHGLGHQALALFAQMLSSGIAPDDVTFIAALSACTHSGLIEQGLALYEKMRIVYGLEPRLEHFGCMVDLLCRAGLLREAMDFIGSMPLRPDAIIWRSLLSGCNACLDVKLGESIMKCLLETETNDYGDYVSMSNIYATFGMWGDSAKLRGAVEGLTTARKLAGCSVIEVNGEVHEFLIGDRSHLQKNEIYSMLDVLTRQLKSEEH
ncbi:pentatricopeptide repeat-containing protein At5g48910-like [Amborella trichopoda]|uniref:pentatricopeptide repeat-containing protein At5g48910-like n=1 Tax=Amborella trichopoda TaxID=13333 RepID=UPI0005D3E30E|nr:pentatricopeptide repeat-containing protein At5g48910-like [Amborella trichopoda]|eukprot:XP_011626239.1 pentatricopeptide repeat-containing protein At5g48910-like [Amborella trichopoda]